MIEKNDEILNVKNLRTYFYLDEGILKAVDGVDFKIGSKKTLGMIGESGCGKSVTAQSILRIVPSPGEIVSGEILLKRNHTDSLDIVKLEAQGKEIRNIRGKEISMIFQEPMTSLSPLHTIGNQIIEAILLHKTKDKVEAREIAITMLDKVSFPNPSQRIDEYPHQLSGGLRQRAMIAMALSCDPSLLIADEPTTALDVTIQAQIIELMKNLQQEFGMSIFYITHDLGVIAEISDVVAVMYLGRVVEYASVKDLYKYPVHPYTKGLLKSIPRLGIKAKTRLDAIKGNVPIPLNPTRECGFYSRCSAAKKGICSKDIPALTEVETGHFVRCFLYSEKVEPEYE